MNSSIRFIDLFAGAGGLSEGFIREGYEPIAHIENDLAACYTLKTRQAYYYLKLNNNLNPYFDYLKGIISREKLYSLVPQEIHSRILNYSIGRDNRIIHRKILNLLGNNNVDLIIGGPPCQAYSLVGRARDEDNMEGDHRNYLYKEYAKFLDRYRPKIFLFENVPGLLSANNGRYFKNMRNLFTKAGYETKHFHLSANKFGVLQNRKRILLIGYRKELKLSLPDFEKFNSGISSEVASIFSDLPILKTGQGTDKYTDYAGKTNSWLETTGIRNGLTILTQHITRPHTKQDKNIYRIAVRKWNTKNERLDYNDLPERLKTHHNRHSFLDRFKVVASDLPYSHTLVAHIAKDGHYYIHPDIRQNRSISVREAARLQSFPDDYYFEGIKEGKAQTAAFKQIGNAVPPLMAAFLAHQIRRLINGE